MPNAHQFHQTLRTIFNNASNQGQQFVDVNAGILHRQLGAYPGRSHRMPACGAAMRAEMQSGDTILVAPPKGQGASLTVRYVLPRSVNASS